MLQIRSIIEDRGFHKGCVLSEHESRDAERRSTEKEIASESVPERMIAVGAPLRLYVGSFQVE